jgi:hypothetical protein
VLIAPRFERVATITLLGREIESFSGVRKYPLGVLGEPALKLCDGDQDPPAAPHDAKLGEHMVFEEVNAHPERAGRLCL